MSGAIPFDVSRRRTVVEEIEAAVDPDAAVQQLRRGVALDLPLQLWVHIDKDDSWDLGFLVRGKKTQRNQHWDNEMTLPAKARPVTSREVCSTDDDQGADANGRLEFRREISVDQGSWASF